MDQQATQITISALADAAEPINAARRILSWHQTQPGREVAAGFEIGGISRGRNHCGCDDHAHTRNGHQAPTGLVLPRQDHEILVDGGELLGNLHELFDEIHQGLARGHRQAAVGAIPDDICQERDPVGTLGPDDTEFSQMAADTIDELVRWRISISRTR